MSVTVNVLCYRSKTLSNGEHPLMICVSKNGKRKYQSLGVSVDAKYWDFDKNKPKRNCPNKELIQKLINNNIDEYSEQVLELKNQKKDFSIVNLVDKVNGINSKTTVIELFEQHVLKLKKEGRLKYAISFNELKNSLIEFNKHLNIYFSDIDIEWIKRYESFLREKGLAENSIGVRFRTLRVIYNIAIEVNLVKQEYYPFKNYKVSKLHEETAKRSISKKEIEQIINFKAKNNYSKLAVDLFYFSYLCAGINFKDIAFLTHENLIDNRLVYTRKKTKKLIKIPIHEEALNIVAKYKQSNNKYLFPILSSFHKTDIQKSNRLNKVLRCVNTHLKNIGKELNLPISLTTYVARHTINN